MEQKNIVKNECSFERKIGKRHWNMQPTEI